MIGCRSTRVSRIRVLRSWAKSQNTFNLGTPRLKTLNPNTLESRLFRIGRKTLKPKASKTKPSNVLKSLRAIETLTRTRTTGVVSVSCI